MVKNRLTQHAMLCINFTGCLSCPFVSWLLVASVSHVVCLVFAVYIRELTVTEVPLALSTFQEFYAMNKNLSEPCIKFLGQLFDEPAHRAVTKEQLKSLHLHNPPGAPFIHQDKEFHLACARQLAKSINSKVFSLRAFPPFRITTTSYTSFAMTGPFLF